MRPVRPVKPRSAHGREGAPRARGGSGDGDTAARIFRAADELLRDRGFDGVSMGDVAQRAGVNKALVFYHFSSKDALFDRVIDRYYEAHTAALSTAFAGEGTLRERVRRLLDAYFDFIDGHRHFPRLVLEETGRGGPRLEKIQRNVTALCTWVAGALADVAPKDGPLAAKHFFLDFSGIVINYFTYAPLLASIWGDDPTGARAREERRAHLHWVAGTLLDKMLAEGGAGA